MEDRKIIELYNYRSENALIETDKKYGKIVTFLICMQITLKRNASSATAERLFHF